MLRFWNAIDLRLRVAAVAIVAAIVLPVVWYLGSPLFIDVTVNEAFPNVPAPSAPTAASTPAPTAAPAPTALAAAAAAPTRAPASTATPASPLALISGQFTEVDTIHKGEGTATLYQLADAQ